MTINVGMKSKPFESGPKLEMGGKGGKGSEILEEMPDCGLSWKQRMIGFVVCLVAGIVVAALSYVALVILHNIGGFVMLFSIGNIIALLSTMFLVGPMSQLKRMFKAGRFIFTIIYLVCIGLTIFFAVKKMILLAIIATVCQVIALILYSLTYIPFATRALRKCLGIQN